MSGDYDRFATQAQFLFLYSGEWGGVCADGWNLIDANVVCRQLGYSHARSATSGSYFGQGCGRIWISNFNCHVRYDSRLDCPFSGLDVRSCDHSGYAGVICGKTIITIT